ncbi:exodeoxyribonuclease V, gamma subunit [delta proteobacterium NaphS2]|nr:exodeoxyribonuclease V, gamma subunit [delta proteobacterium NaphS2]
MIEDNEFDIYFRRNKFLTRPSDNQKMDLSPGFSVIYSNRMEDLRKVAVGWIKKHPLAPLEDEVFIVQSNGMAQWLKLALAQNDGCGISAAVSFQLPARFLWQAYRAFLGPDTIPLESPYDMEPLKWRLMRLLKNLTHEDGFPEIAEYLSDDHDAIKRYQLACRLADLFDQYQVYRADWLEDWTRGQDWIRNVSGNPAPLPSTHRWQARLWRLIQRDVPDVNRDSSRFHLHRRFLKAARTASSPPPGLCRRVIIFGISALPEQTLEALHALDRHTQILFFVLNPCRYYWADILEKRDLLRLKQPPHLQPDGTLSKAHSESVHYEFHPLLASWGKQGRDTIGLLNQYERTGTARNGFGEIDLFDDVVSKKKDAPLLHQVQQAILDLKPLPSVNGSKNTVSSKDLSITFQLTYSRQREVEVLQDHLLSLFKETRNLTPQDIIVMTPDIDVYTPHIESVFGNLVPHDPRFIPFAIADRPNPTGVAMLRGFEKLLSLPASRMTQSEFLDLLQIPAVRHRFGLAKQDVRKLQQWIDGAGIRWGLNGEQRTAFELPPDITANTWQFGLRRMLLGYAVGAGEPWRDIEPYDEIGGLEAELIGPLHDICSRLEKHWQALKKPASPKGWYDRMMTLINDFFLPADSNDQLIYSLLHEILETWQKDCLDADLKEPLSLAVVRDVWLRTIKDRHMSQHFLVGPVNFCTLMPMRAIPFKIVCLLGMNDGEYPRSHTPENFDLMTFPGFYRPGDRSRREDDRYLFLEALLSARERLYISYIARSVIDNTERMPSVLLSQLRDYLAEGWRIEAGLPGEKVAEPARTLPDQLTRLHPLQPFSKAYFMPHKTRKPFTYSSEWRKMLNPPEPGWNPHRLPPAMMDAGPGLIQWIRCLKNPVKSFFNQRLNIYFDDAETINRDQEPFSLDALSPFNLGQRLLKAGLAAPVTEYKKAVHEAAKRLQRTGELPPGGFGPLCGEKLEEPVLQMLERHHKLAQDHPHISPPVEIRFPIDIQGCYCDALEDWLDGLQTRQPLISNEKESLSYSRWTFYPMDILDGKSRIARPDSMVDLWVRHLAGCAQMLDLTSILIAPDGLAKFPPFPPEVAKDYLTIIAEFWWQSLHRPMPVTARTALAYLKVLSANGDQEGEIGEKALAAARKAYEGNGYQYMGELGYNDGIYLKRCYPDFNAILQVEKDGFITLANRIYEPLMSTLQTDTSP